MAAPGGILHKVQLHFEKYIQFTAVPAHSFSPVLSSIKKKENKKERERSQNTFVALSPLYLCCGTENLWGMQRALILLYYTIRERVYSKTPSCTSSVPLPAFVFVPVLRQVSPETR